MNLKVILVDDEKNITSLLLNMIKNNFKEVTVIGIANTYNDAIKEIRKKKPDAVLLDIELDYGTGFDLLELFPKRDFNVVFITAYDHYALEAFEKNAIDYILKPIDIEELGNALDKLKDLKLAKQIKEINKEHLIDDYRNNKLKLKTSDGLIIIDPYDIIYLKAEGAYSKIYTSDGTNYFASQTMKKILEMLDSNTFVKVHKSYAVNVNKIISIEYKGHSLNLSLEDNTIIPVSRTYKKAFLEVLNKI